MTKRIEIVILFVTFLTLFLEAFFIFRPAEKLIESTFAEYQRSEASFKNLFDMTPTPLIMVSPNDMKFVRLNQAATNFLNISEAEAMEKSLRDFLDSEPADYTAWVHLLNRDSAAGVELPMHLRGNYAMVMVFSTRNTFNGETHLILCLVDITSKYYQSKRLSQLAATDGMTGLLNRRSFMENLEVALLRVQEGNMELSLAYLDLDGLKKINDSYGHQEGDWYIMTVASLVRSSVREDDLVGRLGGDEFAVIFPRCAYRSAVDVLSRVQEKVEGLAQSLSKPYSTGFSVGVVNVRSGESEEAENLLNQADVLMYQQKQTRRNNSQTNG